MNAMKKKTSFDINRRSFLAGGAMLAVSGLIHPPRMLAASAAVDDLPEYYDDYLNGLAKRINALSREKDVTDGFYFFTDPHIFNNTCKSGKMIARLVRNTNLKKVFCGGDYPCAFGTKAVIDSTIEKYQRLWIAPIQTAGGTLYTAKGNHDFTIRTSRNEKTGYTYSSKAAHDLIMSWDGCRTAVTNAADPTACYYYTDNPEAKIRYLVADSTDQASEDPNVPWGVRYGMNETQLVWLASRVFATVPDGYSVVVIHHIPAAPVVTDNPYELKVLAGFRELMEAYQNRGKVTLYGKEYDFAETKGRILFDLTGHHHADRQTFCRGILHVTVACDAAYGDYIKGSPFCGTLPRKQSGTIYEQTFDAYHLDPANGLVHATRVGGGQDRVWHARPLKAKAGGTLKLAATKLTGPLTWTCYDGDRIEIDKTAKTPDTFCTFHRDHATIAEDGTLSALTPGDVLALAMDEKLNKELFCVTVA